MVGHGGSSAGSYLADPTSPIPSHCASIVATSTLRVKRLPVSRGHNFRELSFTADWTIVTPWFQNKQLSDKIK